MLRSWKTKAAVQGLVSRLPSSRWWNEQLQRHVSKSLLLSREKLQGKIEIAQRHLENYRRVRGEPTGLTVLELGTGRFPIIPLFLFLAGAARVVTIDRVSLLSRDVIRRTSRLLADYALAGHLPQASPGRLRELQQVLVDGLSSPGEVLRRLGIEAVIADAGRSPWPAQSFDLLISNNTLEHIAREELAAIFREFRRLARRGAVMSHYIDMRDHYAEYDPSITVFNYLRYSSRTWRWFNNSLQYQNRLRVSDYRQLLTVTGWRVLLEDNCSGHRAELRNTPVAEEFCRYPEEELLVCASWTVAEAVAETEAAA